MKELGGGLSCRRIRDGVVLVERVTQARSHTQRLRGLLGRTDLPVGEGLWLAPCRAVHTIGMAFSIDLLWLDRGMRVAGCTRNVSPGRWMAAGPRGAHSVIEVSSGWLAEPQPGDELSLQPFPPPGWE